MLTFLSVIRYMKQFVTKVTCSLYSLILRRSVMLIKQYVLITVDEIRQLLIASLN